MKTNRMSIHAVVIQALLFSFLSWVAPEEGRAVPVYFQFTGTSTSPTGATVSAILGLDPSVVQPNGSFNQTNVLSFQLQFNGAFSASTTNVPATLAGLFNGTGTSFSSLAANIPLTIAGHSGTNNFQFFNPNGDSWSFAVTAPAPGPVQIIGTGTWTPAAAVPEPATGALLLAGCMALALLKYSGRLRARRTTSDPRA